MDYDVIVVGGGAAGMAAAIESFKTGAKTLLIEKEDKLGGILNQCIHNGFGLHHFKEELTGPEYANRFIQLVNENKIEVLYNTYVTSIEKNRVRVINDGGARVISSKAIVLAMGCREKAGGAINLAGTRPVGIYTAGQVQKMVNLHGKLPGKKAVLLGSGDIGLIMARRLTFEGVKVEMVLEIMNTTSGLARNVQQCLVDFDIPLYFNTTITRIVGKDRVEGVYYAKVDENFNVIKSTEKFVECDTVLLSVGLVPDFNIISNLEINKVTNGTYVDEFRQTQLKGVFACGNVLHVHDLVDNVTEEAEIAGKNAGLYALNKLKKGKAFSVLCGPGVRYTIPNTVYNGSDQVDIFFRVDKKYIKSNIIAKCGNDILAKSFKLSITPGEMQKITIDKSKIKANVEVLIEKNN